MKILFSITLLLSFNIYANEYCSIDTFYPKELKDFYLGSIIANKGEKVHALTDIGKCLNFGNKQHNCFKKGYL